MNFRPNGIHGTKYLKTHFIQGSGHGGYHPIWHEFIQAILEGRKSRVSARVATNWTVCDHLAHESAMQGGTVLDVPSWALF